MRAVMRPINRRSFLHRGGIGVLGLAALPLAAAPKSGSALHLKLDASLQDFAVEMDAAVPELMRRFRVPGLSLAVVRDAKLFWSQAYGVASSESGVPVTADTVFAAASLGKPVVAYAAMKLCEAQRLKLDGSLAEYLPEPFIPNEPRLKLITLRHVLSHTSGFPNWRKGDRLTIDFSPGEHFSYSGEGYAYLQRVLEQVSSQPLNDFLQARLLQPLGMKHSGFVWRESYEGHAAQGHDEAGQPKQFWKPQQAIAAASLQATAVDYARFILAMMPPANSDKVRLSEASIAEMLRPQVRAADKVSWGLGWGIQHSAVGDAFVHFGASGSGYQSFAVGFRKQGIGLAVLTNSDNGLRLCKELVPLAIGGDYPIFPSPLIDV